MLYLDTSLLVSAFTHEVDTVRVQAWLDAQPASSLAISDWVVAEFSSALSIKQRRRHLDLEQRGEAQARFTSLVNASITVCAISREHFHVAARYCDNHTLGLRAADALHLAVAVERGATLCTLDQTLAAAGSALGASTRLI